MADYKVHIPFLEKWEGGWSNDPDDSGGATMMGITIHTYAAYRKKKGLPPPTEEDLRNISKEEWLDIYKTMFWDEVKGDAFNSQSVANIMVDWYWMSGIIAIKRLQFIVGTKQDGNVGPKTLAAIHSKSQKELFTQLKNARYNHFISIVKKSPEKRKFLKGWLNRLNDIKWID